MTVSSRPAIVPPFPASSSAAESPLDKDTIVRVPDERLDRCSAIFSPKSTVHATIEFVDVAGLKKGASGTTQFTTGFLSAVKTNDALIQVVRLFANDAVPHPDGSIDPLRDVATFETEFVLADMAAGKFLAGKFLGSQLLSSVQSRAIRCGVVTNGIDDGPRGAESEDFEGMRVT